MNNKSRTVSKQATVNPLTLQTASKFPKEFPTSRNEKPATERFKLIHKTSVSNKVPKLKHSSLNTSCDQVELLKALLTIEPTEPETEQAQSRNLQLSDPHPPTWPILGFT